MSKLGKLNATVLVDGGSLQPHYGPDDTINGEIILSYEPHTNMLKRKVDTAELFGPLKVELKLHGKVHIRIRHERELPTHHDMDLFCHAFSVYDGPFQAEANNAYPLSWSFSFPEHAWPRSSKTWMPTPTIAVPPSFGMHFSAHPDLVDIRVEYLLEAVVTVAGIDVKTFVPRESSWPAIKYDVPRPPRSAVDSSASTFQERVRIQSKHFACPKKWPRGVKGKLNASCSWETPDMAILSLDVIGTHHRQVYPGQLLTYRVKLIRVEDDSTAISTQGATLDSFKVELVATTTVSATERMIGSSQCVDQRTLQTFATSRSLPADFSETNDHTADIVLDHVADVPSSFAHRKVSRSYVLRIQMQIKIADKHVRINSDCPVTVVPAPTDEVPSRPEAYASQAPHWSAIEDELPPPAYEETTANGTGSSRGAQIRTTEPKAGPDAKEYSKV